MRIGLVSTYGVKCGVATYTAHLAEQLSKKHEVVVFAEDYLDNRESSCESGLPVLRCFRRDSPSPGLVDALKANPCDVVHVQHEYGILGRRRDDLAGLCAQWSGRVAMTLHTVFPQRGVFNLQGCADRFIVHNAYGEEYLLDWGVARSMIRVITHGTLVLPELSTEDARKRLGLPLDRGIVLSHAFIERRKNIDKVMKAVARLRTEVPVTYIHVGCVHPHAVYDDGRLYFEECLRLMRDLDLGGQVLLVNRFVTEEEMGLYLAAADIILVPEESTYPEIHGSGVMHTVTPGKPVVASDIPDFGEFPDDAVYKIPVDEEALGRVILEILRSPRLAADLADNLLAYAKTTSWENTARKHVEVYEEMLGARRSPPGRAYPIMAKQPG